MRYNILIAFKPSSYNKVAAWSFGLFLGCCTLLSAQDVHLTNYRFAPLAFNPANTGAFYGNYRVSAVYREQYDKFIQKGYNSKFLNLDSPIAVGFKPHHWVGWGLNMVSDKSGDLGFATNGIIGGAAYHLAFDKTYKQVLTLGAQYGSLTREIKDSEFARFGDELTGQSTSSMDRNLIDQFKETKSDLNIGLLFRTAMTDESSFEAGAAMMHILQPKGLNAQQSNAIPRRLNLHSRMRFQINDQIIYEPAIYASFAGKAMDLSGQFLVEYLLKDLEDSVLHFGVGYRLGDAIELMAGMHYKKWRVGLAYDLTVSSASAYNQHVGGFEIGIQRILVIHKRPKPDPVLFCPRF